MIHTFYSDAEALAACSQVLNTTGLCNDYTLHCVLKFGLDNQTIVRGEVWAPD